MQCARRDSALAACTDHARTGSHDTANSHHPPTHMQTHHTHTHGPSTLRVPPAVHTKAHEVRSTNRRNGKTGKKGERHGRAEQLDSSGTHTVTRATELRCFWTHIAHPLYKKWSRRAMTERKRRAIEKGKEITEKERERERR